MCLTLPSLKEPEGRRFKSYPATNDLKSKINKLYDVVLRFLAVFLLAPRLAVAKSLYPLRDS